MATKKFEPIIAAGEDGLLTPEVGEWAERKYKLVGGYCEIFTTGMRNKWKSLIYIDLFAGAGYARIKKTNKIIMSSALIALSVNYKFNKYIFCEEDPVKMEALQLRVKRHFPEVNVEFVLGDSNVNVEKVVTLISKEPSGGGCLSFCFMDPFSLNLKFQTIEKLSIVGKIDFLILLALLMDANRNFIYYIEENSKKIDFFLGDTNWRVPFKANEIRPDEFIKFLADKYDVNMKRLGYVEPVDKHRVKIEDKNIPLYYLAFYSKNLRGNDFFKKVEKYQSPQQSFF